MKQGDTFLLKHKTAGRPAWARILSIQGFSVMMIGIDDGKVFHEHICRFQGDNPRWGLQISLFEEAESKLSKKHLIR